jgi:hypothetical protein
MDSTGKVSVNHANYSPALVQDIQGVQNKQDIHDAKGISAVSRLHAYRLQYWFRLITLLQKEFPTTVISNGPSAF